MASSSLDGVAKLGAALLFATGALLVASSVVYIVYGAESLFTICVGPACATGVMATLSVPALVLGGLAIFSAAGLWRLRSWGGELAICVSIAILFLSTLWVPKVSCLGSVAASVLIPLASLGSAVCTAIAWKSLE